MRLHYTRFEQHYARFEFVVYKSEMEKEQIMKAVLTRTSMAKDMKTLNDANSINGSNLESKGHLSQSASIEMRSRLQASTSFIPTEAILQERERDMQMRENNSLLYTITKAMQCKYHFHNHSLI